MTTLLQLAAFLVDHADLVDDLVTAIGKGVSHDVLKKSIRDTMIAAADADMKAELGS